MTLAQLRDALADLFFRTNPSRWVHGVAIGLPAGELPPPELLLSVERVLIFVDPAVPGCELANIRKQAKDSGAADNQYDTVSTGPFVGLNTATGGSISYSAPLQYNLPPFGAGTFGAVVEAGGNRYILSSNHILAHNGRARVGTDTVAPGTVDAAAAPIIGSVSHVVNLTPPPWPLSGANKNKVDCALADVSPAAAITAQTAVPVSVATVASPVTKIGRTTGKTRSNIRVDQWEGWIAFSFGTYFFAELIGTRGPDEFARPGDSGSLALTDHKGEGVGLVMARAYTFDQWGQLDGFIILMCSLQSVSDQLQALPGFPPGPITFLRD